MLLLDSVVLLGLGVAVAVAVGIGLWRLYAIALRNGSWRGEE
jgi:hypothetical protein